MEKCVNFDVCNCSCHNDRGLGVRKMHIMPCCFYCDICKLNIARGREKTHEKYHKKTTD